MRMNSRSTAMDRKKRLGVLQEQASLEKIHATPSSDLSESSLSSAS